MALTINDFVTPTFDVQKPVMRKTNDGRGERKVIEGVTTTDNFHQVGFTYFLKDGELSLNYLDEKTRENVVLFKKPIYIKTREDFEKRIKEADKKIGNYLCK